MPSTPPPHRDPPPDGAPDPLSPLAGRVAVVTGAGSGSGRAVAGELARRGARVWCADLDLADAD